MKRRKGRAEVACSSRLKRLMLDRELRQALNRFIRKCPPPVFDSATVKYVEEFLTFLDNHRPSEGAK